MDIELLQKIEFGPDVTYRREMISSKSGPADCEIDSTLLLAFLSSEPFNYTMYNDIYWSF